MARLRPPVVRAWFLNILFKHRASTARKESVMSFGIYIIGFLILIGGLIYGAVLIHMPSHWIVVGTVVLLGLGILTGVKNTRQKDSSS
jgi:cadmium resistance protein CadD (predicted permease)